MKLFIKGSLLIALFIGAWQILALVDWMSILRIEKMTKKTEQKIGEMFLDIFKENDKEVQDSAIIRKIDSLIFRICSQNGIDTAYIKPHILLNDDINAFALPDGHLVIYSGLIAQADSQEELCGVIGHEIAHIQLNHIMKKLIREVGLSALISASAGGQGTETIREIAMMLSSTAFDRKLEKEADLQAVIYLTKANIDPEGLAIFLKKMAEEEGEESRYLTWLSTHPDSQDRANYITSESKKKKAKNIPVLSDHSWNELKQEMK